MPCQLLLGIMSPSAVVWIRQQFLAGLMHCWIFQFSWVLLTIRKNITRHTVKCVFNVNVFAHSKKKKREIKPFVYKTSADHVKMLVNHLHLDAHSRQFIIVSKGRSIQGSSPQWRVQTICKLLPVETKYQCAQGRIISRDHDNSLTTTTRIPKQQYHHRYFCYYYSNYHY